MKTNTPSQPLLIPPFPGKGRPVVGVGPQTTSGNIRAGKSVSDETKWGEKRLDRSASVPRGMLIGNGDRMYVGQKPKN